jgi:hypothetical protein
VLTRTFPPELVDAVVNDTGRGEQRHRLLPARLVVYYVLAMALFSQSGYEEVMRNLVEGLAWESGWRQSWTVPSQPAISQARARLGVEPLAELFDRACVPLATAKTPGGFFAGLRLVSIDGTILGVPDTPENEAFFGRPGSGRGERAAFPQLRLVGLGECGSHGVFAVAMGPCSTGETTLAQGLVASLGSGMLVLADRGFFSFSLWTKAAATGAELVWRTKANHRLPVDERLADGSYLSRIYSSDDRTHQSNPVRVRVVEYTIPASPGSPDTVYRLLTTLLDPVSAPAFELARLYHERWKFETILDELKSHLRGPRMVLRSRSPEGVRQEAYGYLCTHYAIRALMCSAADGSGTGPDRLSFTRAAQAARRSVRAGIGTASHAIRTSLTAALAEICRELVPQRIRSNPRVVKRKMSKFPVKRATHRGPSRPLELTVHVLGTTEVVRA